MNGPIHVPIHGCRLSVDVYRTPADRQDEPGTCTVEVRGGSSLICRLTVSRGQVILYEHGPGEEHTIYGLDPLGRAAGG